MKKTEQKDTFYHRLSNALFATVMSYQATNRFLAKNDKEKENRRGDVAFVLACVNVARDMSGLKPTPIQMRSALLKYFNTYQQKGLKSDFQKKVLETFDNILKNEGPGTLKNIRLEHRDGSSSMRKSYTLKNKQISLYETSIKNNHKDERFYQYMMKNYFEIDKKKSTWLSQKIKKVDSWPGSPLFFQQTEFEDIHSKNREKSVGHIDEAANAKTLASSLSDFLIHDKNKINLKLQKYVHKLTDYLDKIKNGDLEHNSAIMFELIDKWVVVSSNKDMYHHVINSYLNALYDLRDDTIGMTADTKFQMLTALFESQETNTKSLSKSHIDEFNAATDLAVTDLESEETMQSDSIK